MAYVYVIQKENLILGVTHKKYGITMWASGKSDDWKEGVEILRYVDAVSRDRDKPPVRFTLAEYLENPDKQFK